MTRNERYEAYRASMEERLAKAKNAEVKSILRSMRDYVLNQE